MGVAMTKLRGFTLIEIITVILLGTLIVGLVSPSIISSLNRSEVNQAGKALVAAIRHTRALARIKNTEQRITFYLDDNSYISPQKVTAITIPESLSVKVLTAESEVDEEAKAAGVRFFPDGASTGGRITLSGERNIWIINIAWLTGNIELVRQRHD
ncbi:MAG: general secretion pathway protein H [Candidatus Endobugula sp.]|jgi:general secretion pathway protein H